MNWYLQVWKKYAVFAGRSRRMEYWIFQLLNLVFIFLISLLEVLVFGSSVLVRFYYLAVLIPSISVAVRRVHDTGHSGWWVIVPFINLYFFCIDGTNGDNRFGPDPKG